MTDQQSGKLTRRIPRRLIARFYRTADGREPLNDYIGHQARAIQLAMGRQIDRLNLLDEDHPHLAFPHSSQIEGELRELRCHYGRTLYRILYRRSVQFVILLHAFEKHDGFVPKEDKEIARRRWDDFRRRMEARFRHRPSPIGRDAPPRRRP